jgi:GNAT superfamily N-acetyltransferase
MQIADFLPEHAAAFRALNEAWLAKHLRIEPSDRAVLADPHGAIIASGGRIFMALDEGEAVGCAALLPLPDGGFEVSRMAVAENRRGGGVGRLLLQQCIDTATALGAPRLYLEASSVLAPALSLYRSMGFKPLQHGRDASPADDRIDIWMERPLP